MLIEMLNAAASAGAAPQTEFGFIPAMKQGGAIAISTVVILGIMFIGSIYILITKWWDQRKVFQQWDIVRTNFWKAPNLKEGAAKLGKDTAFRQIVDDGIVAQEQHSKMTDKLEAHEWLHQSLALSEDTVNNYLGKGLAFLATTGATAPFVGLFGTVVGIYRALVKIGAAGSASIDKVAGPVGEALIMTALGLLVAVPAVLGYNWLQARNKRISELVHRFSNDILANISSNGAVKPAVAATPARPAAPPAKPAAAPAAAAKPAAGNTSLKK